MLFQTPTLQPLELEVVAKIDSMRRALSYAISTPARWYGVLRQTTFARNIRQSNSIEGIRVTRDDAMAAVGNGEPLSAKEPDWLSIVGYRNAMTYALQLASDPHFSHSEGLIRSLHFMMLQHELSKNPGRYRPGVVFVRDEKKQQNVYEGPDADLVPTLMRELTASLNEQADTAPTMIRAAMAHLNLVMIHPFSDGNGRMARCLQTLVLGREQIIQPPFCSIEEYLGRFTEEYYDVLAEVGRGSWHPENDCRAWIRFNLVAHFRQASWLLQRTRIMERVWGAVEQVAAQRGIPERALPSLVNATLGYRVRNSDYRASAEVSEQVASRDLKTLVEAHLLVADGQTRGRVYVGSKVLRDIYSSNCEPRMDVDPFAEKVPASTDEIRAASSTLQAATTKS
jgi:Fic family protein